MKILILGASGFIGKNISSFLKREYEVGHASLRSLTWKDHIERAAVIINLVGKAHEDHRNAKERDYYYVNVELAKETFETFKKSPAQLLIHVSSIAAVEEFEAEKPLDEQVACRPVSWYGRSKWEAEQWMLSQKLPSEKKIIILRPPMVHGNSDKGNLRILYKFLSAGIPYPLASFDNSRSFISIDNFCFLIQQIIAKTDKIDSGIYHVADDEAISTKEILQIIRRVTGRNIPELHLPQFIARGLARLGDILPLPLDSNRFKKMTGNLVVSNAKIKQALGLDRLPLTVRDGLIKTIDSYK